VVDEDIHYQIEDKGGEGAALFDTPADVNEKTEVTKLANIELDIRKEVANRVQEPTGHAYGL
jgi:hypothetical protein